MTKELKVRGPRSDSLAPIIVDELKAMAEKNNGLLLPEHVVEAARPEDSPLHSKFTWDDSAAAERYRLWQARLLISVSVEYIHSGNKSVPTKVFVSLSTDRFKGDGGGYRAFVDVMADSDQRNQLLMDSLQAMTHFQERYKQLSELQEVFSTMKVSQKRIAAKVLPPKKK